MDLSEHDHSAPLLSQDVEEGDTKSTSSITDKGEDNSTQSPSPLGGIRRILKLASSERKYLFIGCIVLFIRLPFSLAIPHFVSTTIGSLARKDFDPARTDILIIFVIGTIDALLDFWCIYLFGAAKERIVRELRIDTFASILRQEMGFFDETNSGDLTSRLTADCGQMTGELTWFFRFSIESFVRITGIFVYMMVYSPVLACAAFSIIPLVAVINKKYGDWLGKNAKDVQSALAEANIVAQEAFSCIRTVIAFSSEDQELEKYSTSIDKQFKLNMRQLVATGIYYMVISTFLINTCVQAALLFVGSILISKDMLTAEVLLAFMLYQGQLQEYTLQLFQSYSSLVKSSGAGDKVFQLLDRVPHQPGTGNPDIQNIEETEESNDQQGMELSDIAFFYPSRSSQPVLVGLNLKIPPGKTIALVGPSGCGKSTIISLLQRMYDPASGVVSIGGKDLREINIMQHRRNIGIVTQEPILFSGSILSNITYGVPGATNSDAIKASKMANAHDFIVKFPDGYKTNVGERGLQLSGGQKQRIAIARAIMKNPSILLLDEATSALDNESERVVQAALDRLLHSNNAMTTVVIAHRLQTVRNADFIAVMKPGEGIVELGPHGDLMAIENGHYRKMVETASISGVLCEDS